MGVYSPEKYLTKVVDEYTNEADATYESRRELWRVCVLVYELAADPEPWIDKLIEVAAKTGMRQRDIATTIASALRRARQTGAVV